MPRIQVLTDEEIEAVRHAGTILAACLKHLGTVVKEGMTTAEVDRIAEEFITDHDGATPAFRGYHGYPSTLCTSVNEQCVHGLPGDRVLEDGDIISTDCGVMFKELYTDACRTFAVGEISEDAKKLLQVTEEALKRGIAPIKTGAKVGDISSAVQTYVEGEGCSIVSALTGHGLGKTLHQYPDIPNFGTKGTGSALPKDAFIAVEPIVCLGSDGIKEQSDNWTIATRDGSLAAHFEHCLLVTDDGYEIIA